MECIGRKYLRSLYKESFSMTSVLLLAWPPGVQHYSSIFLQLLSKRCQYLTRLAGKFTQFVGFRPEATRSKEIMH